ncbi:hypothetical protein EXIGLDRAFT_743861 [Exidia glandulosa HHB12029]|uniref:Nucleoporin Nup120/160-domain-containing protein n=1 Tax=Exidia glandulosa HHB12029 TaxID=1314781 RepID=A0A165R2R6_EXIGL|nr:hypothetical protein EXIGLDRAFT_743861 [Exidia glandulosa HHB12029]
MERSWCLTPSHVSAISSPAQIRTTVIQTVQRDLPIQQQSATVELAPEHASYASFVSTQDAGGVLLRVIQGRRVVELSSLTGSRLPPHRFLFPSPVLPHPAIVVHQLSDVYVLVVTESGSLFRLSFSALDPKFFHQTSTRSWCYEHRIDTRSQLVGPVHAHDPFSVAIGASEGGALLVRQEPDGRWFEGPHADASSRPWLSVIPFTQSVGPSQIISFASYPRPSETSFVFSVSQDRYLRCWQPNEGCTGRIRLPTVAGVDPPIRSPSPDKQPTTVPFEDEPRRLVRVIAAGEAVDSMELAEASEYDMQVMVFIPTPAGDSGGFFQLYGVKKGTKERFTPLRQVFCPARTAFCDLRDFDVYDGTLYTLWDDQGASALEWLALDVGDVDGEETWYRASLQPETELTPSYLEELLLDGGSLTDVFMDVLLRPGLFSPYSLQAAVRQYTDSLLSLPPPHPVQLSSLYPTLAENIAAVVGCTVTLAVDPATGLPQRENFYNALKRDWEGFIARCREFERRARWPLGLAVGQGEGPIVLERERILLRTFEDEALQVRRELVSGAGDADTLLAVAWNLRTTLSASTIASIETQVFGMLEQELGDSYVDTILRARESVTMEELSESYTDDMFERLSAIPDFEDAFHTALVTLSSLEIGVKDEETDDHSLSFAPLTDWQAAVVTSYTSATVLARYDTCLALIAVTFFASEMLQTFEPLLVELFAAFRSLAMYRALAVRPAGDPETPSTSSTGNNDEDDVLNRLNNLRMMSPALSLPSRGSEDMGIARPPTYSLLHRLLSQMPLNFELPRASHQFLDAQGLLRSRLCASVTAKEAAFADALRRGAFLGTASEVCRWLPRTPAVAYIRGRIMLDIGQADQSAAILERLAGTLGPHHMLTTEDSDALRTVLPQSVRLESEFSYFLHLAAVFEEQGYQQHVIAFNKLAIETATEGVDTNDLWFKVFRGYVALGDFEEAYMALISTPHDGLKRESVSHLVQAMCEADAVDRLLALNFVSMSEDVEAALSFKSRNADPLSRPLYSSVLYSWYIHRGDFRSAALTMYLHARKLGDLMGDPSTYEDLATWQIQALLVAINALGAVEPRNAWFTIPFAPETTRENRKRRKMAHHIPEDKFAPTSKPLELVELDDLRWEYTLVVGRLDLWRRDRNILGTSLQLSAADVVAGYSQENLFDAALTCGRALGQDLTHVFMRLTEQCVRLATREIPLLADGMFDWLLTDEVESWSGTHAQRAWRYLQLSLERHDDPKANFPYRKAMFEAVLEMDRLDTVPSWLVKFFEENQPDYLIRAWLRKGYLYQALEHSLKLVRKTNTALLTAALPRHAGVAWLPYALIDEVIAACESTAELQASTRQWREELKTELSTRVKKMQRWTKDSASLLS